eukprot:m.21920 g.21920  ORF g.21920 m.21920 type:complete len:157 (+) comp11180_c0_seq2:2076-2546(+)
MASMTKGDLVLSAHNKNCAMYEKPDNFSLEQTLFQRQLWVNLQEIFFAPDANVDKLSEEPACPAVPSSSQRRASFATRQSQLAVHSLSPPDCHLHPVCRRPVKTTLVVTRNPKARHPLLARQEVVRKQQAPSAFKLDNHTDRAMLRHRQLKRVVSV